MIGKSASVVVEAYFGTAFIDAQHLKKIAVAVRVDTPVEGATAGGDVLDVDIARFECLDRLAIKSKRYCGFCVLHRMFAYVHPIRSSPV